MKKSLLLLSSVITFVSYSQDHFSGINTSKRVGILNSTVNPAELSNMANTYEISIFNVSTIVSNNKITFQEIMKGENIEDKFFSGNEPANMRLDAVIYGPAFAMKYKKWAFGLNSTAYVKANAIDVDVNFGKALTNSFVGVDHINTNYNQRMNAASWGEIGLTASRNLFDNNTHKFSAGATFKLLFPGSFMNLGVSNLEGDVTNVLGNVNLTNATAQVNIAYSGSLANNYNDASNYSKFFAGGLNGVGADIGVNYQWKQKRYDEEVNENASPTTDYKLNLGLSVRNIGAMTFKDNNNVSTNYNLNIDASQGESLNLNQFDGSESITDIEQVLLDSGYLTKTDGRKDFRIKLPTVINAYADYQLASKWYVSAYIQQKLNDDSENDFTTIQNVLTLTPRFSGKHYEIYVPFTKNEVSDFTTGFGFRLGGFYMGSGSIVTALINDSTQADFYLGFRVGI